MEEIVAALKQGNNALVRVLLRTKVLQLHTYELIQNTAKYGNLTSVLYVLDAVKWTQYNVLTVIHQLAIYEKVDDLDRMCGF